jgi:hypothetical protein
MTAAAQIFDLILAVAELGKNGGGARPSSQPRMRARTAP